MKPPSSIDHYLENGGFLATGTAALTRFTAGKTPRSAETALIHSMEKAMTPSWTLRAWPPVLWQATSTTQLQLVHLDTRVLSPGDSHQPSTGQTVWGAMSEDGETGVAWDWIQIMPGVVAMVDPMSVVTNLRLLGPEGEVLTAWEAARHLNNVVHALPWQNEVGRVLASH